MSEWKKAFIKKAKDFPIHKPYHQLSKEQKSYLWKGDGSSSFPSINNFFKLLEENLYKIQYRVMLSRYRGKTVCPTCEDLRLREETSWVKIDGPNIQSMTDTRGAGACRASRRKTASGDKPHKIRGGRRFSPRNHKITATYARTVLRAITDR